MQLVKNLCWDFEEYYASGLEGEEQSISFRSNKAIQMQLAWLLERRLLDKIKAEKPYLSSIDAKRLMKEKVLEMYFNSVNFAPGLNGVAASSEFLFGTQQFKKGDITAAQALCLAVMPNRPSVQDPEYIKQQVRELVERMVDKGYIPNQEVRDNLIQKLDNETGFVFGNSQRDGFINYVKFLLKSNPRHGLDIKPERDPEGNEVNVSREVKVRVKTTIDPQINDIFSTAVGTYLPSLTAPGGKFEGKNIKVSALLRDAVSGEILGTYGNIMNSTVTPASLVKPFLISDVLRRNVEQAGQSDDVQAQIRDFWATSVDATTPVIVDISANQGRHDSSTTQWVVNNAYAVQGSDKLPLRKSLAQSMNTSHIRYLLDHGYSRMDVKRIFEKYGIVGEMGLDDLHYPMMLGSISTNLLRLGSAFSTFVNRGVLVGSNPISSSSYEFPPSNIQPCKPIEPAYPVGTRVLDARVADSFSWGFEDTEKTFYGVLANDDNLDGSFPQMFGTLYRYDDDGKLVGGSSALDGIPFAWKSGTNQAVTYTSIDSLTGQEVERARNSALICGGALPEEGLMGGKKPVLILNIECDDLPKVGEHYIELSSAINAAPLWRNIMDSVGKHYTQKN